MSTNSINIENIQVSVIIVSWKSKHHLRKCIESISEDLESNAIRGEIIVVDNNSLDGTVEMVSNEFPNVILIENKINYGFSIANNQAINISRGKYILFLNPDTEVKMGSIKTMLLFLDTNIEYGVVGPRLLNPDGNIWKVCSRRLPTLWTEFCQIFRFDNLFQNYELFTQKYYGDWNRETSRDVECLVGAAMLARSELIKEVDGFNENVPLYLDDIDLCRKLLRIRKIRYLADAIVFHHHNISGKQQPSQLLQVVTLQALYVFFKTSGRRYSGAKYVALILISTIIISISLPILYIFRKEIAKMSVRRVKSNIKWLTINKNQVINLP